MKKFKTQRCISLYTRKPQKNTRTHGMDDPKQLQVKWQEMRGNGSS
jgi:hypothetical protein